MGIKPVKYAISAGVGGAHVISSYADEVQGWTEPFRRSQDYVHLIGFGIGLVDAVAEFSAEGAIGEALALSSEPLLIRSLYEAARHYLAGGSSSPKKSASKAGWKLVTQGAGAGQPQVIARYV